MASCKECIYADMCRFYTEELAKTKGITLGEDIFEYFSTGDVCEHFKDRSRFVELPCKVGDTVYSVHGHPDYGYKIEALQAQDVALICSSGELSYSKRLNYFGKTVFLTREEAEKALNEREENA